MLNKIDKLSVFLPVYNEEGNIEKVVASVKKNLLKVANIWEIIIVDDGSKDRTKEISLRLAKEDKRIRVVVHKENKGYGGALKTGFEKAKYPWIAFMDSDGQFDFGEITKFIAKKDEADLILGFRKKRADSIARKIFTFGWAFLARILLGLRAKDYSCGFKMIKKSVYEKVQPLVGEEKVTQIELLVKARRMGFKAVNVGVSHYPRTIGSPTGAKISVVIKSVFDLVKLWGKINNIGRKELFILLAILVVGAFLRLYKIDQYMTFLGDEGRDAIIVRRIFTEGHPPLIGPGTSVGNIYLGPLYYYMMALPLLIANFSPVGPAVMIAILGIITIAFVWYVGRKWFGSYAGLIAAGLYAISPTVVTFSQSSWNPNIMPFFALLTVYSLWKIWRDGNYNWMLILGIAYAFVLQSHYLGLFLAPVIFLFWILKRPALKYNLYALGTFLVLMSPLVIFDFRHNFINFLALKNFASQTSGAFGGINTAINNFVSLFIQIMTRLPGGRNETAGIILALVVVLGGIYLLIKKRINFVLAAWLIVGAIGLSFYRSEVYDHYTGFLFPAPFLLIGAIFGDLILYRNKLVNIILGIGIVSLVVVNVANSHIWKDPNRQLQRSIEIAQSIKDRAGGKPFNLATITSSSNRDPYAYFLLLWGEKVVDTDPNAVIYTVTDQLFVVCEKPKDECKPLSDPTTWITNFGWSQISDSWQVAGANVFKLVHQR